MGLFLGYVVPLDWSRPNSSDVRRVGGNGNRALHLRALISTSVVVLLTACGSASSGEPDQSEPWGYASALEGFIADARSGGASEAQIATLQSWIAERDTPPSDVHEALGRMGECLDAAGVDSFVNSVPTGDYPEITYGVYANTDAEMAVMDECDRLEFFWINTAYQLSPGVTARRQREDTASVPAAIECLTSNGVTPGEATTLGDLEAWLDAEGIVDVWDCVVPEWAEAPAP